MGEVTVLRFSPDEAFAIGARHVDVDDRHAIVDDERGFVGAWCTLAEFGEHIEPRIEWSFGDVGFLGQGSIAGVPAKLWLTADDKVLLLTAAAFADELADRLGLRR